MNKKKDISRKLDDQKKEKEYMKKNKSKSMKRKKVEMKPFIREIPKIVNIYLKTNLFCFQ